ncbi:tRNA binding domain protein [Lactococcus termiticola]|uniref:tRNA binding domain protein n=2 Tax=Lactococcus termiticola TaxID=2169526 RepID=A0A2R5HD85_9LACT|nr:tRNA binding domain protein [Lactococcus termiticola]
MLIVANDEGTAVDFEKKGNVARVFRQDNGETVGWNLFEPKLETALSGDGQVELTEADLAMVNQAIKSAGFTEELAYDGQPKFVVAEILEMEDHPDSDHLHICKVEVGMDQPVQIVCGAPNAKQGLKTIAALPGAMMPSGSLIFPGKLRGVDSYGMLCSARELALPNSPEVRGIIELSDSIEAGQKFEPASMWMA